MTWNSIIFVCSGNICRSPTAEAVMRKRLGEHGLDHNIRIDSAGTHGLHAGQAPDARAQEVAREHGIDMGAQTARKFEAHDFRHFDLVLAMDHGHYHQLARLGRDDDRDKLALFMDYATGRDEEDVPDPYYGGPQGFYDVFSMIDSGVAGLIEDYLRSHGSSNTS